MIHAKTLIDLLTYNYIIYKIDSLFDYSQNDYHEFEQNMYKRLNNICITMLIEILMG